MHPPKQTSLLLLALLLFESTRIASSAILRNEPHSSSNNSHNSRLLLSRYPKRIIVQYKANTTGRDVGISVASKIYYDFRQYNTIVIDVPDHRSLSILQKDPTNITSITYDDVWTQQGMYQHTVVPPPSSFTNNDDTVQSSLSYYDNVTKGLFALVNDDDDKNVNPNDNNDTNHHSVRRRERRKRPLEQIPYGIKMIQGTLVEYNAQIKTPITICIVDTGVSRLHPDLDPKKTVRFQGINYSPYAWDYDTYGHGTHVAGTIGATQNNKLGVRGVSDGIPIYVTRGLDNAGQARESDVQYAIQQCDDAGSKIISLSLSGPSISPSMIALIDKLYTTKNILFVAAAGNGKSDKPSYPASYKNVIAVSSVNSDETFSSTFSNYGPWIELSAPGASIISTGVIKGSKSKQRQQFTYSVYSGTSMATPHVAASAAVLWSHFPTCTATQIRYVLAMTAKDKGPIGCDDYYGYGIVQLYAAYSYLKSNSCLRMRMKKIGVNVGDGTCSLS